MIRFFCHDALTGRSVGELNVPKFQFNAPISGFGSLTCDALIPIGQASTIKQRTTPQVVAIYAKEGGSYLWGGPIVSRVGHPGGITVQVKALQWKQWLYTRFPLQNIIHTNYDQYQMAYDLIDLAISKPGSPVIKRGTALSGVTRDFTVQPTWSVGEALDSFGKRDGGFEWDFQLHDNADGEPELSFVLYAPGSEHNTRRVLTLDMGASRNEVNIGDITDDATEFVTRAFAIGDGQWPDAPVSSDEDPFLASNQVLLRESVQTFSGVTQTPTLFDHAHARRLKQSNTNTQIPIEHPYYSDVVPTYEPGDRARLIIMDDWYGMDVKGTRIIDRTIAKQDSNSPVKVTDLIDLGDVKN